MKKILAICGLLLCFASRVSPQSDCVHLYGDINQDNQVNVSDLTMLANALAGNIQLSPVQFAAADVYYDGVLSTMDLYILANFLAGNVSHLPVLPNQ